LTEGETRFPTIGHLFVILTVTFLLIIILEVLWGPSFNEVKMLLSESLIIVPALVLVFWKKYSFRNVFRWKPVDSHVLLVSGAIGLGLSIVIDEVDCLIQKIMPMPDELIEGLEAMMRTDSVFGFMIMALAVVIVAALVEEMLFRGLFLGVLEHKMEIPRAILISSLIFAFIHLNPWWFVEILILGVLLGVMALRSKSIFPGVVVHGLNNALALFLVNTDAANLDWYRFKGHVSPIWVVLGLGCVIFGFRVFWGLTETE